MWPLLEPEISPFYRQVLVDKYIFRQSQTSRYQGLAAKRAVLDLLDGKAQMKKLRKIIYGLLLGCFLSWVIVSVCLHLSYSSNLPTISDDKSGHIYRMVVNHGFVVYGTEREFRILGWVENSQPFAMLCFAVVFIVGLLTGDMKIAGRKLNE